MIRKSLHLITGLLLCGCTMNNIRSTSMTNINHHKTTEHIVSADKQRGRDETPVQPTAVKLQIRPECTLYVPLPVPKPVRIDFKELEAAESGKEINAIALRNVKVLHQQLYNYAARQNKHYAEYVKHCVVE